MGRGVEGVTVGNVGLVSGGWEKRVVGVRFRACMVFMSFVASFFTIFLSGNVVVNIPTVTRSFTVGGIVRG